mgnify:CR=1 FL=1
MQIPYLVANISIIQNDYECNKGGMVWVVTCKIAFQSKKFAKAKFSVTEMEFKNNYIQKYKSLMAAKRSKKRNNKELWQATHI